jgi:phage terminase large subunit-like protein
MHPAEALFSRVNPIDMMAAIRTERMKRAAERSLYEFVQQAWCIVEPGVEFTPNWHIEEICEHLQAVSMGDIKRLLINIPPRHSKSTIVSVMWPCWEWIDHPSEKYLFASYSGVLSMRDSLKCRRLIQSNWYQDNWGDRFCLTGDQNAKQRFENDKTGYRIASSIGGTATGDGGSRIVLDDPHSALEAQSDTIRTSTIEWLKQVWSSRLNDMRTDAMVTIMQRLHEEDASGLYIKEGGWEHLCIPARFDGVRRKTSLGAYDPRKKNGELLWPARVGEKELSSLERSLGDYGTSGQLQQSPTPTGGGIIKVDKFKLLKELPQCHYVLQSYDTAFTEKTQNDPTAMLAFGIFQSNNINNIIILDAWEEHYDYPTLRKAAIKEWHSEYGGDRITGVKPRKTNVVLIEKKGSGIALCQDLNLARVPIEEYNPGNADKISRAHQASPIVDAGHVYVLESKTEPGKPVTWVRKAINDLKNFPVGKDDHYVDAFTQALIYLRDINMIELGKAAYDEIEEQDYEKLKKSKQNPYYQ